jgi:hypothetical protein
MEGKSSHSPKEVVNDEIKVDDTIKNIILPNTTTIKEKETVSTKKEKTSNELPEIINKIDETAKKDDKKVKKEAKEEPKKSNKIKNEDTSKIESLEKEIEELKNMERNFLFKQKKLEDDVDREKEINRQLKATHAKVLEEKNKEIKDKDKNIQTITLANAKLMQTLDELKKEVDEHFDKVNVRQVSEKMKKSKEDNSKNPLEIVVKVKEKELKNANHMIEILRKDNETLKNNLDNFGDYNLVSGLQDKLKVKEKEILDLNGEIKTLTKVLEDHKKCPSIKKDLENELKTLHNDVKILKDSYKTQQNKMKEDEKTRQRTVDQLINMKKELDKFQKAGENQILNNTDGIKKLTVTDKKIKLIKEITNPKPEEKKSTSSVERPKKLISEPAKSKSQSKRKLPVTGNDEKVKIFSKEDKSKLEGVLSPSEIEKLEKRYDALEHSKQALENKYKAEIKKYMKKFADQESRLEFLNIQLKETEHKWKINSLQINEYKSEQKAYQRKLNETKEQTDSLYNLIREKDQENKILINQLNSLRKLVKHNAVPPMDSEVVKHLEKIKMEESTGNSIINDSVDRINNNKMSNMFITGEDPESRPKYYQEESTSKILNTEDNEKSADVEVEVNEDVSNSNPNLMSDEMEIEMEVEKELEIEKSKDKEDNALVEVEEA